MLENLENQGYHLQMPPAEEEYIEHLPEELLRRNPKFKAPNGKPLAEFLKEID